MPFKPGVIEEKLQSKFLFVFESDKKKHRNYVLRLDGLPPVRTHVSHSRDEIRDKLLGAIARELHVDCGYFKGMISCNHTQAEYYQRLRATLKSICKAS